jgi:hypothetical protein
MGECDPCVDASTQNLSNPRMTKIVPPRAVPEQTMPRTPSRSRLRWSLVRSAILRLAALLLLFRGAQEWLQVFGVEGGEFLLRGFGDQLRIGSLAVLCVIGAAGLWFLSVWGIALFIVCLAVIVAAPVLQTGLAFTQSVLAGGPFLWAAFGLFVLFILAAWLSEHD